MIASGRPAGSRHQTVSPPLWPVGSAFNNAPARWHCRSQPRAREASSRRRSPPWYLSANRAAPSTDRPPAPPSAARSFHQLGALTSTGFFAARQSPRDCRSHGLISCVVRGRPRGGRRRHEQEQRSCQTSRAPPPSRCCQRPIHIRSCDGCSERNESDASVASAEEIHRPRLAEGLTRHPSYRRR